ncbi:opacity protein [Apibacter adventoris]|nr:opacity protein [Apibacter adventoris]
MLIFFCIFSISLYICYQFNLKLKKMKKLFLVGALALGSLFASAQEKAGFDGRWFLGGAIGYDHDKIGATDVKNDNFRVTPLIGYFITPTIAVGGQIGYEYGQTKGASSAKVKENTFIIQPLARKYWGLGEKLYFFGQLDVPIKFGDTKVTGASKTNFVDWGVNFRPGLDVFLTPNWSVETTIGRFGYGTHNPDGVKHDDDSAFGINLNDVNLGVKYVF